MKIFIIILVSIVVFSCSHSGPPNDHKQSTDFASIYKQYGNTHFVGIGIGAGANEQLAIKIAKARALGELADNVKVTILSKLEVISTEISVGDQSQVNESVKEKIISLGNATVRSPKYEILNVLRKDAEFRAEVLAKKLINEHVEESARDLEFSDDIDKILELIK